MVNIGHAETELVAAGHIFGVRESSTPLQRFHAAPDLNLEDHH